MTPAMPDADRPAAARRVQLRGRPLRAQRVARRASRYVDDQRHADATPSWPTRVARVRRRRSRASGLRREERVLLLAHDSVDWPVAFLGALYAGIVPVAVNTLLTADDYAYMLADSRARGAVVSGALLPDAARRRSRAAATRSRDRRGPPRRRRRPAATRARFRRAASPTRADALAVRRAPRAPTTSRSGCTRRARPAGRRAPCTRTATSTGPTRCTAQPCWRCAETTSCSRPRSCSSPTASATR